MISIQQ